MVMKRRNVLHFPEYKFVCYTGMETDLIFSKGIDLPEFAAFPLLKTRVGRELIGEYYRQLIALGKQKKIGVILDSVTWVASRDRAKALGYTPDELREVNVRAVEMMRQAHDEFGDVPTLLSANIGPRGDAYDRKSAMSEIVAEDYHAEQVGFIAQSCADFITAYTIANVEEAIGMVRAACAVKMPIVISFTVETDGRLPSGMALGAALKLVDEATDSYALYYMINCAHPSHFEHVLDDAVSMERLRGLVVNASACSHAELDNATELDDGDPAALGLAVKGLSLKYADICVLGGCCGTDMRHLKGMFG